MTVTDHIIANHLDRIRCLEEALRSRNELIAEVRWVIANTESVVGLRLDGESTCWGEVKQLYMPTWRTHPLVGPP